MLVTALVVALLLSGGSGVTGVGTGTRPGESTARPEATPAGSEAPLPTITLLSSGGSTWTGIEPAVIGFSGDAGDVVTAVTWTSWTPSKAVGEGTWGRDDCVPNCAEGTVTDYRATLTLSHPVGGRFTIVVEETTGPYGFRLSFADPSATGWRPWTTLPPAKRAGHRAGARRDTA